MIGLLHVSGLPPGEPFQPNRRAAVRQLAERLRPDPWLGDERPGDGARLAGDRPRERGDAAPSPAGRRGER